MRPAGGRALVVEDERAWQQILSEILADAGLTVEVASNLEEAVACLRSASHRLAVVDLSLGGADHRNQDGLRVLDAVRQLDPGCVSMLLTGYATVELAVSTLTEHGAFTCLQKETFRRRQFRKVVLRALASPPPGPARDRQEAAPAANEHSGEAEEGGTALVVEDDAGWRGILQELLSEAGYRVRLCSSFGQAWGYLRRERYALAVVDLSLTGWPATAHNLDGYRLLGATRAARIPTILVSGIATPADIERAFEEHGIFACLQKQAFDRRAFLRAVDEARAAARQLEGELGHLTRREHEVLELLVQGRTNKEIAEVLVITQNTVKRHLKSVFEKLDVHRRAAAAARAVSAGMPADVPRRDSDAEE